MKLLLKCQPFISKGKSYQAEVGGHDDLMMNLVMFGWFASTPFFEESTDVNMKELLYKERIKQIEDDMIPVGIFGDHNDDPEGPEWKVWKG